MCVFSDGKLMKKFLIILLCTTLQISDACSQTMNGYNYFENKPKAIPVLFAPGIISDGFSNRDFTMSPDGDEIFYTIQQRDLVSTVMHAGKKNSKWSQPDVAPFSGVYNDLEATFSTDGQKIFFSSNRPLSHDDSTKDYNIWFVEKKNASWLTPVALGSAINSEKDEFYPSLARNGNLYFTTQLESGKGKEDIVMSKWQNGEYQPPVSLPDAVNSKGFEFNAFVDADEQFIIFSGSGRNDDLGKGDLYISIKKNGEWQPAANLGKNINSAFLDYCPFVSWDKKYLFFTSSRPNYKSPFNKKQTAAELKRGLQNSGNGFDDIYWIRFDGLLEEIKKR